MQPFELPDFYVPWPARLNPNLDAARVHSKAWAHEVGILGALMSKDSPKIWDERDFDKHDYALLCSYIHPEAPTDELNLMTEWNIWAFYVDDHFLQVYQHPKDYAGAKKYLDRVPLFMPIDLGPTPAPINPMECGLANLWLRTAPAKSTAWRSRIFDDTKRLFEAFLWELESISERRIANPIEYIEMRRRAGAALWAADLVEHAVFVEIPERIALARPIRVLRNAFADAVHLRNDIFSYQREVLKDGELTNAVLVFEQFLDINTQEAVNLVNNLLTSRLQQFDHTIATELEFVFAEYNLDAVERANMITYIRGLQDWQSGAHEWHIETSRYLNPQTSTSGQGILGPPTGLGTAAARITPQTMGLTRFRNYRHLPYKIAGSSRLPKFYMPFETSANPHLTTARQAAKVWARKMGMFDALPTYPDVLIWDEYRFEVTDLAFFNALVHPNATTAQLSLAVCWATWGTYTDDYFMVVYGRPCDMAGAKIFQARLSEFMPLDISIDTPIPITPVEYGLADLWRHIDKLPLDERRLLRQVIEEMTSAWLWELSNRIQNRIPDPIDYIEMRRKTSGASFLMLLPRAVYGQTISPEIHSSRTIRELNNVAIDYFCLINDIFSYQKEIEFEGDLNNGVLVIENFLNCDHLKATDIANRLITARMKQFEHIAVKELPILFQNLDLDVKTCQQVLGYVEERKHFMCGALQWHTMTARYKEAEFQRPIKPFLMIPTGLGTTVARIVDIIHSHSTETASLHKEVPPLTDDVNSKLQKTTKAFAVSHLAPIIAKKTKDA